MRLRISVFLDYPERNQPINYVTCTWRRYAETIGKTGQL